MMKKAWLPAAVIAVALVLFLVLFSGSIYTVNQTEQVIITQFGNRSATRSPSRVCISRHHWCKA